MIRITNLTGSMRLCDMPQGSTFSRDGGTTIFLRGQLVETPPAHGEQHKYYVTQLETGEVIKMETETVAEVCNYFFADARQLKNMHSYSM